MGPVEVSKERVIAELPHHDDRIAKLKQKNALPM